MFERRLCRRNYSGLLASDGRAPAPRRPAARMSGLLASDGRAPAPRRPAARTASWGEGSEGGRSPPPSVLVACRKDLLPNGIRAVTEAMPHVRSVAVGIWVETGSRVEPESRGGISHLIEHQIPTATERTWGMASVTTRMP